VPADAALVDAELVGEDLQRAPQQAAGAVRVAAAATARELP
jgi:hypothetical protein